MINSRRFFGKQYPLNFRVGRIPPITEVVYLLDYSNATFTRASEASYVDPRDGWTFADTSLETTETLPALSTWSNVGTPVRTTGVADPFGGTLAETIEDDDNTAYEYIQKTTALNVLNGSPSQITHYIKKDAITSRFPEIQHVRSGFAHIQVNTSTGAAVVRATTGWTDVSIASETAPEDSGWWKITLSFTPNATGTVTISNLVAASLALGAATTVTAVGAITYYPGFVSMTSAWKSTNIPRIFSDGAILIESSRTNFVDLSENPDTEWVAIATLTASVGGDPDGNGDADRWALSASTGGTDGGLYRHNEPVPVTSGSQAVQSLYIKRFSGTDYNLNLRLFGGGTFQTALTITDSFARYNQSITPAASVGALVGAGNYAGGSTFSQKSVDVWGMQVESGSFATSYIRTAGAAATRADENGTIVNADVPITFRNGKWSVTVIPTWDSGDFPASVTYIYEFDANNYLAFAGGTTLRMRANGVNYQLALGAFSAGVEFVITVDFPGELMTVNGFGSVAVLNDWSADSNALGVGSTGATGHLCGTISRPIGL